MMDFSKLHFDDGHEDFCLNDFRLQATVIRSAIQGKSHDRKSIVAIDMPRSARYLSLVVASWLAGCTVVFLNKDWPLQKKLQIISDVAVDLVISDDENYRGYGVNIIDGSVDMPQRNEVSVVSEEYAWSSEEPLYIIYTSGSTGVPKGVVIPWGAYKSYTRWCKEFFSDYLGCKSLLLTSELTFDITLGDIAFAIVSGARVYVETSPRNFGSILKNIYRWKVECLYAVPSTHYGLLDLAVGRNPTGLESLKIVVSGGDKFGWSMVERYCGAAKQAAFFYVYGPTEFTINCFALRLDQLITNKPNRREVPIGKCFGHLDYVFVDEHGNRTDEGELCVSGDQAMLFYYGDTEKTNNAFLKLVEDGKEKRYYRTGDLGYSKDELVYVRGRVDGLEKIRGYRIHPDELTNVVQEIDGVKKACTVIVEINKVKSLSVFYEGEEYVSTEVVAKKLEDALPVYMHPSRITKMKNLPLSQNGKIERLRLAEIASSDASGSS